MASKPYLTVKAPVYINVKAEHERLRDAVVEAAQKWRWATLRGTNSEATRLQHPLAQAVDDLKRFEASHAIGQKDGE